MPKMKREREDSEDWQEDEDDQQDAFEEEGLAEEGPVGVDEERRSGEPESSSAFFPKGSIKYMRMHNFMTYVGTVKLKPGPKLNLIIGPNGTGKSSLVCALAIGLNAPPKVLDRGKGLPSYVRRGCRSCWIETTVSSGGVGRDCVIKRLLEVHTDRSGREEKEHHSSKWWINGREVTAKKVDEVVKALNIQFDNLCQFLPQERVKAFSQMDPYQLLEATQRALGDSTYHDMHCKLIALRREERDLQNEADSLEARLDKLTQEQGRQQADYERFQKREGLLAEAAALRRRARWLEVRMVQRSWAAAKERFAERKRALHALQQQQEANTQPVVEREQALQAYARAKADASRKVTAADKAAKQLTGELTTLEGDLDRFATDMLSLEEESTKRAQAIAKARSTLATAQQRVVDVPQSLPQEMVERRSELAESIAAERREQGDLGVQRNNLASAEQGVAADRERVQIQLAHLNSRKYQVLQTLEGNPRWRNVAQLHARVEELRAGGAFRGAVFGPLALELQVSPPPYSGMSHQQAAQYVENACFAWLGAFVVTDKEDERVLSDASKQVNCSVRIAYTDPHDGAPFQYSYPAGTPEQLAHFGLLHTVAELFTAPPILMDVLSSQCGVDSTFIASNAFVNHGEEVAVQCPRIRTVFMGIERWGVVRSRYTTAVMPEWGANLHPARWMQGSVTAEEEERKRALEAREQQLAEALVALSAQRQQLDDRDALCQDQIQAWMREVANIDAQGKALLERRAEARAALGRAQNALKRLEDQPDPLTRRPQLRAALADALVRHLRVAQRMVAVQRELWTHLRAANAAEISRKEAEVQLAALRAATEQRRAELEAASTALDDARQAEQARRTELDRAKARAEEAGQLTDEERADVDAAVEAKTPLSELDSRANEKQEEADRVGVINSNVVNEFRRRKAEIDEKTRAKAELERGLLEKRAEIDTIKERWLPDIRQLVSIINESYSHNFKGIGYAGEVRLREDEDFDKFAIDIMVQFRPEGGLVRLTGTGPSGGERAVSTILYIIALQNVTDTPFRVVDEINQGMDPYNERKIYKYLVDAASVEGTPQCFLLTPKLLPDLPYNEAVSVCIINNGNAIAEGLAESFNMEDCFFGSAYDGLVRAAA